VRRGLGQRQRGARPRRVRAPAMAHEECDRRPDGDDQETDADRERQARHGEDLTSRDGRILGHEFRGRRLPVPVSRSSGHAPSYVSRAARRSKAASSSPAASRGMTARASRRFAQLRGGFFPFEVQDQTAVHTALLQPRTCGDGDARTNEAAREPDDPAAAGRRVSVLAVDG